MDVPFEKTNEPNIAMGDECYVYYLKFVGFALEKYFLTDLKVYKVDLKVTGLFDDFESLWKVV